MDSYYAYVLSVSMELKHTSYLCSYSMAKVGWAPMIKLGICYGLILLTLTNFVLSEVFEYGR